MYVLEAETDISVTFGGNVNEQNKKNTRSNRIV